MIEKTNSNTPLEANVPGVLLEITKQFLTESGEPFKRDIPLSASLQRHLNIDSLGRAELFSRIEKRFSITLPDTLLAEAETLADVANYIYAAKPEAVRHEDINQIRSHGERPKVDPSQFVSLIEMLMIYGREAADTAHIYFQHDNGQEEIITYGQLLSHSLEVAQSLRNLGLKDGETVAIMQPTHPGFFYSFFGTLLAGAIPVPIYPPFRMHMLEAYAKTEAHILGNAEVRILITFEQAETLSRLLKNFVPSLKEVVTVENLLKGEKLSTPYEAKSDDFAFIQYTSGSTSQPKGVLLTHFNLLTNIRAYGKATNVQPTDVAVSWLPLYHDMGLIGLWLGSLYHGVPLVLLAPFTFLSHPERWLWAIHYHRGTVSGAPNFAYELCVRKVDVSAIEGLDLSSWRIAANGAEKVYPKTLEAFAEKFGPYGFDKRALLPVYGLAESTVALAIPTVGELYQVDYIDRREFELHGKAIPTKQREDALAFVNCGHAIANHAMRIVDEHQTVLGDRVIGHLQFKGPSSMQGYYKNPVATAQVYHQGWIDSGDYAYMVNGDVYIKGRRKDLIIKAGRNIFPAEIEEIVGVVPGVRQGCVIAFGVTNTKLATEQLVIVAETRETDSQKREALRAAIKDKVATVLEMVPDQVVLAPPNRVPKTSSGKLQRAEGKAMYLRGEISKKRVAPWVQISRIGIKSFSERMKRWATITAKVIYTGYVSLVTLLTILPCYLLIRYGQAEKANQRAASYARFLLLAAGCPLIIKHRKKLTEARPVIYVANHASYIDSLVMLATLPPQTRIVGKKELKKIPGVRGLLARLNVVVVDRFNLPQGIEDSLGIEETLREGFPVMIFPEGTFGYAAGLRPFRLGAFKVAVDTGNPVCPIAIQGTRQILRNGEYLLKPGKIVVTVSDPIKPLGKAWEDVIALRREARESIAQYCGEPLLDFIAAQKVAPH